MKRKNIRWAASAVILLGLLTLSSAARATSLPAGMTVGLTNLLVPFTGTLQSDTGSTPYTIGIGPTSTTGMFREWVASNGTGALCSGCLSFVYQVQVTSGSVARLETSPYDSFMVDVSHSSSSSASLPGSVAGGFGANTADRDATGNVVGFNFTPAITASGKSFLEIVNTNAMAFQPGSISIFAPSGAFTSFSNGFAPVPEPATVLLLGSGLVALSAWRRRR